MSRPTSHCRRTLAALATLTAATALAGCGEESTSAKDDPAATQSPEASSSGSPSAGACEYPADPMGASKEVDPPPADPSKTGQVDVTIATSAGDLGATLDADATPCTVNSFVSLAEQGYFDDTPCHRLTTQGIFVLQCGDPSGTGSGGPGYSFGDELTGKETYPAGTLAMANAGEDTNGSQFFIVYKDTPLPPYYTVFGTVDADAVKTVAGVAADGSDEANGPGDGAPKTPVEITGVSVG